MKAISLPLNVQRVKIGNTEIQLEVRLLFEAGIQALQEIPGTNQVKLVIWLKLSGQGTTIPYIH